MLGIRVRSPWLTAPLVLAALVSVGSGAGDASVGSTWSGTWSRAEDGVQGDLILTQSGSSVSGRYTWNDGTGRVSGTVRGDVLSGAFNETHYRGAFQLRLSGKSFTGTYSGENKDTGGSISGPFDGQCVSGACLENGSSQPSEPLSITNAHCKGSGAPDAFPAALNEVHVTCYDPDCQFHKGGSPADAWLPAERDTVLKQGDEITCDPDGVMRLAFADNSTVDLCCTTQLKIGSFFTEGGVVKTVILLKMGEIAAQVNKSEATKSDFRIKEPTAVASVRGTALRAFYDPGSGTGLFTTTEGLVTVTPANRSLPSHDLTVGQEVEVTGRYESPVASAGHAGARGGLTVMRARDLALGHVQQHLRACHTDTPRTSAFSIRPAAGGWSVSIRLQGRLRGTATWTVSAGRVRAANATARRLDGGCRR